MIQTDLIVILSIARQNKKAQNIMASGYTPENLYKTVMRTDL